jgi:O-acetyl-ADP-ribose deacetylase
LLTLDYRGTRISLLEGDIVDQYTEAIVNAANSSLMGGGGVDGAIHRAGGPAILRECLEIRRKEWPDGLSVGEAVITTGGNLRAKYVIHTVGPVWYGGSKSEEERLAACHENSLRVAIHYNLRSIAFPAISTGAFGYPVTLASKAALKSVRKTLDSFAKQNLEEVRFVLFTTGDYDTYALSAKSTFS